jgi:hypothetical protein
VGPPHETIRPINDWIAQPPSLQKADAPCDVDGKRQNSVCFDGAVARRPSLVVSKSIAIYVKFS